MGRFTFRDECMYGRKLGVLGVVGMRLCNEVFEEE